jgi:hypothetical protein
MSGGKTKLSRNAYPGWKQSTASVASGAGVQ